MQYFDHYVSPLGGITLAGDGTALTGLWFDGQKYFAASPDGEREKKELPLFAETKKWLDIYFGGRDPGFTPPLSSNDISPFRLEVREILLRIPFGKTSTYGQIADELAAKHGKAVSAQAVGGAVGHNPVSLIVPCHRVVGSDGNLTGYAGGIDKKIELLRMEGADLSRLFAPKKSTAP